MATEGPPAWLLTERLRLRRPVPGDARRYLEIHSDPRTFHHLPSAVMRDESEASARLATWRDHWDEHGFGYAVVETSADGAVVGVSGACHTSLAGRDVLNLHYRFDPDHWGRGLATEAARAVVDELSGSLPAHPVVARIARDNPSSIRVAERLGMQRDVVLDPDDPVPHWIYGTQPLGGRLPGRGGVR